MSLNCKVALVQYRENTNMALWFSKDRAMGLDDEVPTPLCPLKGGNSGYKQNLLITRPELR